MCRASRPRAADTSAQEAEAARQRELLLQQAELDRRLQQEMFERQQALENQRHADLLAANEAEAARQLAASEAARGEERSRAEALAAAQEAERAAAAQLAQERADAALAWSTGRRSRVDQTRNDIASAYSGFDDAYFDNFRDEYISASKPAMDREFKQTVRDSRLALADRGNLNSTAAAIFFGDLARERATSEASLAATATDATQQFRNTVDAQRSDDLNALNYSTFATEQALPDGVTDIDGALRDLDSELGLLTGDARRRATSITRPGFSSIYNSGYSSVGDAPAASGGNSRTYVSPSYNLPYGSSSYTVGG